MTSRNKPSDSDQPESLRTRAELRAREHAAELPEPLSPERLSRLNQELQIHQIELEMQNDELSRAQAELEAARAKYFDLYDLAPVGYLTVSELGVVLEANLTAATLLGTERGALIEQPLTRFVVREDQDLWHRHFRQLFAAEVQVVWEMRLARVGQQSFWARLEAIAHPDGATGRSVCRLILSDVNEHRRIEMALQESEERYRVIVESSRDLIFFLDRQGRMRWENPAYRETAGTLPADREFFHRVHPLDAPQVASAWHTAQTTAGAPVKLGYRLRTAGGGYRSLESTIRKISFEGEQLWCFVSADATEVTKLRRRVAARLGITGMVGCDPKMLELAVSIKELADEDVPVLILGESGTGKELIASAIHREGARAAKNFVAINCGAIPDTLLETELFGHVKGSFTGAHRDKKGRFELADGGSIFLDEVSDLSLAMQVKLLRVLQEGTFEKVGAEVSTQVDVRVISATNKDLRREVAANRFREDLFYRLSVVPLTVPPLRERLTDIPLLVTHILDEEVRRAELRHDPARQPRQVSVALETLALLIAHRWPGNIRELQNVLRFALIKCKGELLRPEHLPPSLALAHGGACGVKGRKPKISNDSAEKALEQAGGRPGEAARSLGVSRATLYRHLPKDRKAD